MTKYKYITSPIFYPNSDPHLGTAYTLILCDFLKKAYEIYGYTTIFSTGTDEHGKKIQTAALQRSLTPEEHVLDKRKNFLALKEILNINFDKFIGTHSEFHQEAVKKIWTVVMDNGYIYKSTYEGWYSERDEQYFKETDLIEGKAPTGASVIFLREPCYFFKLSIFKEKILNFYNNNPNFIQPNWKVNEILGNLNNNDLEDLCISRDKKKLSWGIEVPNDPDQVIYVWFDALTNYITNLGYPNPQFFMGENKKLWENSLHVIGKDILNFHGIIWPAMLIAAELPMPQHLIVHGWLKIEGEKMSKSIGNIVDPAALCAKYPSDYVKYFLLKEIPVGSDYDFKESILKQRINEELADKIGNLVNRVLIMTQKYCLSSIPKENKDREFMENVEFDKLEEIMFQYLESVNINGYLTKTMHLASLTNKYIEDRTPWKKDQDLSTREKTLYNCFAVIYKIAKFLYPVTPNISKKILYSLGIDWKNNTSLFTEDPALSGNIIQITEVLIGKFQ